jgi:hypothetical protein
MGMTPRNLIRAALRSVNVVGSDGEPTSEGHQNALEALNMLLDTWSADELLPSDYIQKHFSLTANKTNYTIGDSTVVADRDGICAAQAVSGAATLTIAGALASGGSVSFDVPRHVTIYGTGNSASITFTVTGTNTDDDTIEETITGPNNSTVYGRKQFKTVTSVVSSASATGNIEVGSDSVIDTRRPLMIISAFVRDSTGVDYPCYPSTRERYNIQTDKDATTTSGSEITQLYYDATYPAGEIYVYKVPSVSTFTMYIDMWQPFKQFSSSDIDTDINMEGAYVRALKWNLATEVASDYGRPIPDNVRAMADSSLLVIKKKNTHMPKPGILSTPLSIIDGQPAINKN